MQPDAYNDLYSALEYKSEPLPVEREALRAHKRAQRQRLADHLKNRETHDGKQITDKRKTIVVGGALATILMGWIGYTNVSRGFMAQAASVADEPAALDRLRPAGAPHADLITPVADRPGHDRRYAIDPTKIETELGWRPRVSFEEGIEATVRWYLDNEDWWRPLRSEVYGGERLGLLKA